jgi:hypothetical protein
MKKILFTTLLITTLSITLTGCGGGSTTSTTPSTTGSNNASDNQNTTTTSPYQGIWLNPSFGEVLAIDDNQYSFYQMAGQQCLLVEQNPLDQLTSRFGQFERTNEQLRSHRTYDLEQRQYQVQDQLPFACEPTQLTGASDDPQLNFDWAWQSINDYYAGFEVRNIDWDQVKIDGQLALTDTLTQSETQPWEVLTTAINQLADPHAMIHSNTLGLARSAQYTPLHQRLANQAALPLSEVEPVLEQTLNDAGQLIVANYLGQSATFLTTEQVIYGELNDTTAYVNLRSMNLNGDSNQSNFDQATLVAQALQAKLNDKTHLVIDLRFNLGGSVLAAQTLANALAINSAHAYTCNIKTLKIILTVTTLTPRLAIMVLLVK